MSQRKHDTGYPDARDGSSLEAETLRLRNIVGPRIAAARRRAGMSQGQLAAAIGSRPWTVSRYESGRFLPRQSVIIALSEALGTTTDYLYGLEPEPGTGDAAAPRRESPR